MYKKLLVLMLSLAVFGCTEEKPVASSDSETEINSGEAPATKSGKELLEELKAKAVDENDIEARLAGSIEPLREEYTKSAKAMSTLKDVAVSIDADCNLLIENSAKGKGLTKVNLKQLDTEGFGLIPDLNPEEYPGLRIKSIDEAPVVEEYLDGQLVNKNNELIIHLATRESIERITPVMLQMLYLCQDKYQ